MNTEQYAYEENSIYMSLSKLTGKKVIDIIVYPSREFGEDCPVFKIGAVVIEGGKLLHAEGEHDMPYLVYDDDIPGIDEKTLTQIIEQKEEKYEE